jgi:hypothetical protein
MGRIRPILTGRKEQTDKHSMTELPRNIILNPVIGHFHEARFHQQFFFASNT